MKRHLKRYTSLTHYIEFLKKQSRHAQHVYGVIFAGTITALVASVILYEDYGFWHEKYRSGDALVINESQTGVREQPESPKEMLARFFEETKEQFGKINTPSKDLFNGKEVYRNEGN